VCSSDLLTPRCRGIDLPVHTSFRDMERVLLADARGLKKGFND